MTEENKKIKLLIVDDDKFLLDMYSLKFKLSGFDVDTAAGSSIALDKFRKGDCPDVILMDIIMPTMDGLELLEKIREEKLVLDSLVVMLTNQPDEYDRAKGLGIDGYIVKATTIPSDVVTQVSKIYSDKKRKK